MQSGSDPTPLPNQIVEVSENLVCHKKAQLFPVAPSIAKPTIVVCVAAPANRAQPTWSSDSQFIYSCTPGMIRACFESVYGVAFKSVYGVAMRSALSI